MKIVVRGTNWVGDAVMQIPALKELRRIFSDAEISLHTRSWARGIFEDADFVDEILAFETEKSALKTVLAQAKILREKRFDLAVIFPNSFETALTARLAGITKRFGYAKDARSFLLTDAIKIPAWKNEKHEVFYYLNLVSEIEKSFFGTASSFETKPAIELQISEKRKKQARKILAENGVDLSRKTVALGVGSTNSRAKRWHHDYYAVLNDRLQNELNANVALVGAENEIDVSMKVFEKAQKKPIVLTGKTNLSEAAAILSVIDLLVANDTGLAHLAPATETKTLVIFGPTNEKTTRPFSENAEVIRKTVECSPCMLRDCPIDHRCMIWISPDEVFLKAKEKLIADE